MILLTPYTYQPGSRPMETSVQNAAVWVQTVNSSTLASLKISIRGQEAAYRVRLSYTLRFRDVYVCKAGHCIHTYITHPSMGHRIRIHAWSIHPSDPSIHASQFHAMHACMYVCIYDGRARYMHCTHTQVSWEYIYDMISICAATTMQRYLTDYAD